MRVDATHDYPVAVVRFFRVRGCWRSTTAVRAALQIVCSLYLSSFEVATIAAERRGLRRFLVSIGLRRIRPFTTFGPAAFERLTEATSCS